MKAFRQLQALVSDAPVAFMASVVGMVTLVRVGLLFAYQTSLGPDEAQYWFWSTSLDWGYYSKPPVIAWIIALPTMLFGDTVATVRLLSPILIGGSAFVLFLTARRLYGDRAGILTGIVWLTVPAVMLGASIVTTDVPLLFFWALALYGLTGIALSARGADMVPALMLGLGLGFGLLSKYAMLYFLGAFALAALISPLGRSALRARPLGVAFLVAAVLFAPNVVWNLGNGLQTVGHTADNASWTGRLHPEELLSFLGDQFGVFGPIMFLAFLIVAGRLIARALGMRLWRGGLSALGVSRDAAAIWSRDLFLLPFALLPILLICAQALMSRAHGNWAMAAYPAATILVVATALRWRHGLGVLLGSVGLHAVLGLALTAGLINFAVAEQLGLANAVKRLRGWEEQAAQIALAAKGHDAIIADEREILAHLTWELRGQNIRILAFDLNGRPDNTYEHAVLFDASAVSRVLIATQQPEALCLYGQFAQIEPLPSSFVDLAATRRGRPERTIDLYTAQGFDPARPRDCGP